MSPQRSPTRRALALLGVAESERRSVGLMGAHSFFMGSATVFFETAASAAFLSRFPSSTLPWVYLAAAGNTHDRAHGDCGCV